MLFIIIICYYQSWASCLLNGASCPINVGQVVLGQVLFGVSYLSICYVILYAIVVVEYNFRRN